MFHLVAFPTLLSDILSLFDFLFFTFRGPGEAQAEVSRPPNPICPSHGSPPSFPRMSPVLQLLATHSRRGLERTASTAKSSRSSCLLIIWPSPTSPASIHAISFHRRSLTFRILYSWLTFLPLSGPAFLGCHPNFCCARLLPLIHSRLHWNFM